MLPNRATYHICEQWLFLLLLNIFSGDRFYLFAKTELQILLQLKDCTNNTLNKTLAILFEVSITFLEHVERTKEQPFTGVLSKRCSENMQEKLQDNNHAKVACLEP